MPLINRPFRFFSPGDESYFRRRGGGGSRFERINPGRPGNLVRSPGKKLPTLGI